MTEASNKDKDMNSTQLKSISLDGMAKPAIDISKGNELPLTGYFQRKNAKTLIQKRFGIFILHTLGSNIPFRKLSFIF